MFTTQTKILLTKEEKSHSMYALLERAPAPTNVKRNEKKAERVITAVQRKVFCLVLTELFLALLNVLYKLTKLINIY